MPDRNGGTGRAWTAAERRRSRWVRVILFALAGLSLIVGAAAFYGAVQANSGDARQAIKDARAATVQARAATVQAQAAAAEAKAASEHAAATRDDLCTLLNIIRQRAPADEQEAADANRLFLAYRCR